MVGTFKCKYTTRLGTPGYTFVTMRLFYPMCPRINVLGLCNQQAGAFVAAVTVCNQRLFA
jgi:hypothetical protein